MGQERQETIMGQILIIAAVTMVANTCPYPCTCTDFKVDCYDKGLKQIPDNFPPNIVTIDLQYNQIEIIGDQFHNLTSLQEVMLRFNRISYLADGAFSKLPNLKHINLGSNVISDLNGNAFQSVFQMKILDLTDNQLTSVNGSFEGLSSLTKLVLTRNHIEELTETSLKPLTSLVYFMADENKITHVHPAAFHSLEELSFISLSKNPLDMVDDVLSTNTLLSYLNLDDCQLQNVPTGLPWATRNLQLSRNNITTISKETFTPTRFLGIVMLNDNGITHVEPGAFTPIAHLQELWLNGNQLSALPTPIPATVGTLSLDNNDITTVSNEDFPHDSQMKLLSLKGNKINKIDPFTFSRLTLLEKLYLSDNAITVLQDRSFFGMRNLTILEVSKNPIMHIDTRFAAGLQKLHTLDLSYVADTEPFVKGNFFRDIPFLKALILQFSPSLANNILTSNETLKSFYNLKKLDVRDNNLQSLDTDLPRFFHSLKSLQLAHNAWVCDSHLLWLYDWMQSSRGIFEDLDEVVCAMPIHLAGAVIGDLPYHAFFYTTTIPTIAAAQESAGSGEADYNNETDDWPQMTTDAVFPDLITHDFDTNSATNHPEAVTAEGNTDHPGVPDEFYTTAQVDTATTAGYHYWTDVAAKGKPGKPDITTAANKKPLSTSTKGNFNTTEKSPPVKGYSTTTTAKLTTSTVSSTKGIITEKVATSTSMPRTTQFAVQQQTTLPVSSTPYTTTIHPKPTDTPRYGGSKNKTPSDLHSASPTRTIIIATCVSAAALIIIIIALVLILRQKHKIRLVFHRAMGPKKQTGDTEFVLRDQDDPESTPDSSPMTQISESEHGSVPSMEDASNDSLSTKLV